MRRIEIGSRLRELRVAANLTLSEVGQELKVARSTVASWESAARRIDGEHIADLALLYGCSCDYILLGTHSVPQELKELFARVGSTPGA